MALQSTRHHLMYLMYRRWYFGVLILGALLVLAKPAHAVETPRDLYYCTPKEKDLAPPPPQPKLPAHVAEALPDTIASNGFKRVCPAGEVPYPTKQTAPPKLLPSHARQGTDTTAGPIDSSDFRIKMRIPGRPRVFGQPLARDDRHGATPFRSWNETYKVWYSWAGGGQAGLQASKGYNGMWAWQTNEQPYIPYEENMQGSHSLAQLWGHRQLNGCDSYVEIGWTESAGQFGGNYEPHLFISAWDCGVWLGYMGLESPYWHQSSGVVWPGAVVTHNDKFHAYGMRMDGNNWWFYYDGQWVGYIAHEAWKTLFPDRLTSGEAGGEVATQAQWTCADMGYGGLFGSHPWAAMFSDVWYEYNYQQNVELAKLQPFASDYSNYHTGNWSEGIPGAEFRYGGTGWC